MKTYAGAPILVRDEAVLFAFDDHSIPLQNNLFLTLKQVQKHPESPVLLKGPEGAPDDRGPQLYGSVLSVDGKLRMWYMGLAKEPVTASGYATFPCCYAESDDGVHWVKPNLGLVEWRGSRDNNICFLGAGKWPIHDCASVMHDPEDPDQERRYKMTYISRAPASTVAGGGTRRPVLAASGDGHRHERRWLALATGESRRAGDTGEARGECAVQVWRGVLCCRPASSSICLAS